MINSKTGSVTYPDILNMDEACITEWDFATDTVVKEAEYPADINDFKETRLYAKWIKT